MTSIKIWVLLVAMGLLSLAALIPSYRSNTLERSQVFCNDTECLIIVSETLSGWKSNVLLDIGHLAKASIGGAVSPTHFRQSAATLWFRPEGIQRRRFENLPVVLPILADGRIYTQPGPRLWSNGEFVAVEGDELRHYVAAQERWKTGDFSNQNGWMGRTLNAGDNVEFTIHGSKVTISKKASEDGQVVIEMISGSQSESLVVDKKSKRLSAQQFHASFGE